MSDELIGRDVVEMPRRTEMSSAEASPDAAMPLPELSRLDECAAQIFP